ncbi:MAG: TetR/AcrR family transcriptional regulator, partial [bacterium]
MGYRHTREEILDAAAAVAVEGGMAALTFGAVGRRLGISDRMIVYYFPTKPALVIAVAEKLGAGLELLLEAAFGSERLHREDLLRRAWPALAAESNDRVFSLFFEIVGLAAAAQPPYDALGPALLQRWVDWLTPH